MEGAGGQCTQDQAATTRDNTSYFSQNTSNIHANVQRCASRHPGACNKQSARKTAHCSQQSWLSKHARGRRRAQGKEGDECSPPMSHAAHAASVHDPLAISSAKGSPRGGAGRPRGATTQSELVPGSPALSAQRRSTGHASTPGLKLRPWPCGGRSPRFGRRPPPTSPVAPRRRRGKSRARRSSRQAARRRPPR